MKIRNTLNIVLVLKSQMLIKIFKDCKRHSIMSIRHCMDSDNERYESIII